MSKEDVERMKQEAEAHASEDRKRRETVDARNEADTLIAVSEKTLTDAGDKAKPEDKTAVEEAIKELKEIKDNDDVDAIKAKIQSLSEAIQKVGASMYETPSAEGGAQQPQGEAGSDEKPVDADYKEVPKEEDKKDESSEQK